MVARLFMGASSSQRDGQIPDAGIRISPVKDTRPQYGDAAKLRGSVTFASAKTLCSGTRTLDLTGQASSQAYSAPTARKYVGAEELKMP